MWHIKVQASKAVVSISVSPLFKETILRFPTIHHGKYKTRWTLCACLRAAVPCYLLEYGCSSKTFPWKNHSTEIRLAHGETDILQTCTGNQFFCLCRSFLCWLACRSLVHFLNCSCFSVPLWALLVHWVPLVFVPGWNKSLMSAALKKDIKVLPRDWTQQWRKGKNCTDMEAHF